MNIQASKVRVVRVRHVGGNARGGAARWPWLWWVLSLPMLVACMDAAQAPLSVGADAIGPVYGNTPADLQGRAYRVAVHPLYNPAKLLRAYQPLIDHLQRELPGHRFQLEASRDYAAFERKLQRREPDLLLPNPWQTLRAIEVGYSVIAMAGEADDFKGLILVRRDARIEQPADLKDQTLSCPSPTALAACIMPQYHLYQAGLKAGVDYKTLYVGSQESSILSVYQGRSVAAASWPPPWRAFQLEHPIEAAQLRVAWQTAPLVNNSVMVRNDVPVAVRDGVQRVLLALNDTPSGRSVLTAMQAARFFASDDRHYDRVRAYIARFERDVRAVETAP
jgi:phosphonate transport system substrate-binding protein